MQLTGRNKAISIEGFATRGSSEPGCVQNFKSVYTTITINKTGLAESFLGTQNSGIPLPTVLFIIVNYGAKPTWPGMKTEKKSRIWLMALKLFSLPPNEIRANLFIVR